MFLQQIQIIAYHYIKAGWFVCSNNVPSKLFHIPSKTIKLCEGPWCKGIKGRPC
jgi:hypothetical protein